MDQMNCQSEHKCCGRGKVVKLILILLGVLALTAIIIIAILRDRIVNVPQYQVSVVGRGKISYQPDIANVTMGVAIEKQAKADEALKQLNEKMAKVMAAISAQGISDDDIQTQTYILAPQVDFINNVSTTTGYVASEQLVVKVKDLVNSPNRTSQILAAASLAGANQISGVNFDLSNLEELKQKARTLAIADAKSKASSLAQAAGVKLGKIIGWWENIVQVPGLDQPMYSMDSSGKGGVGGGAISPTVSSGSQDIIIEISVNYRIR